MIKTKHSEIILKESTLLFAQIIGCYILECKVPEYVYKKFKEIKEDGFNNQISLRMLALYNDIRSSENLSDINKEDILDKIKNHIDSQKVNGTLWVR